MAIVADSDGEDSDEQPAGKKSGRKKSAKKETRGRPKGSTKQKKQQTDQLKVLVQTVSDLAAARPGMELWKLEKEEVEQLCDPLAALLAKSDLTEKISEEYADTIALVAAAATIFLPRIVMQVQVTKQKKQQKGGETREQPKRGNDGNPGKRNQSGPVRQNGGTNAGTNAGAGENVGPKLFDLLPGLA